MIILYQSYLLSMISYVHNTYVCKFNTSMKNAEARLQEASLDGSKNVTDKLSDIQTNTEYENRGPSNL